MLGVFGVICILSPPRTNLFKCLERRYGPITALNEGWAKQKDAHFFGIKALFLFAPTAQKAAAARLLALLHTCQNS